MYLGSGQKSNPTSHSSADNNDTTTIIQAGSDHFSAVLQHWEREIISQIQTETFTTYDNQNSFNQNIEQLVIVGISAGAIGVLNHFEEVLLTARNVNVQSLRIILDSSAVLNGENQDESDIEFQAVMERVVDFNRHLLCHQSHDEFRNNRASTLPCCLSTHCMLEHDPIHQSWSRGENSTKEDGSSDE